MLIAIPAAFALSRMKFWGSATLATGVFLTYLIPETLLFIPLFKMMAVFNELTGIQLINRWWVNLILYPTLTVPFATWLMIGYFASIPKELDEAAIDRRRDVDADADQDLHSGRLARPDRRDDLRLHGLLGAVPLSARLHDLDRPARAAGRHHHVADQGRHLQLGADHDRRAARRRCRRSIIYAFLMDYYIAGLTAGATKG